jgi:hypothetical protein
MAQEALENDSKVIINDIKVGLECKSFKVPKIQVEKLSQGSVCV